MVNSVDPGYCKTDQNNNQGYVTPERGARTPFLLATLPDDQFLARRNRTSSGSPIAICAERRLEPDTTIRPMMLQMSSTSMDRNFLPARASITLQMSSTPSISAPGPEAVPPNVFNGAPNSRIKMVEYENDLPV